MTIALERHRQTIKLPITTACATRWLPFIQHVLKSDRAKSRCDIWSAHMRHRLALRDKMRDFFVRVWSHTARMRSHEDATARLRMLLMRGTKYALACSARARSVYEISRDLSGISHFRRFLGGGMGSEKVGWEASLYS